MAHGVPDWGGTAGRLTVYQLTDLAELAVRLGSIVRFDRRGDVIFLDWFDDGLNRWVPIGAETGDMADLSMREVRSGLFSCRLHTAGLEDSKAYIYRNMTVPVLSQIGVEFSVCLVDIGVDIDLFVQLATGAVKLNAGWKYEDGTTTLSYLDSGGEWADIVTDLVLYATDQMFHTFKLVIDPENTKYARLIVNDTTYDLSDKALESDPTPSTPYLFIQLRHTGNLGVTNNIYTDDVIVTQNEP